MTTIYLSPRQIQLLRAIAELAPFGYFKPVSRTEISERTGISRQQVTRLLGDLIGKRCVARSKDLLRVLVQPDDERIVIGTPPPLPVPAGSSKRRPLIRYAGYDASERLGS